MQIVIDIPEEDYRKIIKMRPSYPEGVFCYIKAIQNGTPLSKGHGQEIDVNKIKYKIECEYLPNGCCTTNRVPDINATPTVIKAESEE